MALTDETSGNGFYMPVAPAYGGGNGGMGFGNDGWWIILLLLAFNGGWGGCGGFGGWGGGFGGMMYEFPWLLNGQNAINANTSSGFQNAQVQDSITSVRDGVSALATQLCGGFAGVTASVTNAQNAIAQQMYTNQIADLERSFAAQTASTQGLSAIQTQLAQCCCDNRAGIADLRYTVATEACADRQAVSDALRDVIVANTASTQRILDQLCQDKIDAKNDTIAQLRQELLFARGQASQDVQTAAIRAGQATTANQLLTEMRSCPIPAQPVYGSQPIFTCGGVSGCGCSGVA